ncbi:MAG: bifunctional nuclease family protein, partial [Robiginitalea sp.]
FEAQSIAIALEKEIKPPRPLTHDLFKNFADRFDIVIKQVIIHKLVDGVFYSSIICERDKVEEIIDARTSDAIALALRFDAPIFTYKAILDKAGIFLKFSSKDKDKEDGDDSIMVDEILQEGETVELDPGSTAPYKEMSLEDLNKELDKAVTSEDYEKAARIRDEISKRQS